MNAVFKALADDTRRDILDRLYAKAMTRQAVMKHLSILEGANLVAVVWSGREKRHYLNPIPIHAIQDRWIKKFERNRIDALSALKAALEGTEQKKEKKNG